MQHLAESHLRFVNRLNADIEFEINSPNIKHEGKPVISKENKNCF